MGRPAVHPVAPDDLVHHRLRGDLVLGAQGVDGGRDEGEAPHPERGLDVVVLGEDGRVVAVDEGAEEAPGVLLGHGGVDVAAPDPLAAPLPHLLEHAQHGAGLGVVHDDEVVLALETEDVLLHRAQVLLGHLAGGGDLHPLQGVVEELGDLEEVGVGLDYLPFRVQAQAAHQGDQGVEYLRHPPAVGGAVDVQDPRALELLRPRAQRVDDLVPHDGAVGVNILGLYRDPGQHGGSASFSSRRL